MSVLKITEANFVEEVLNAKEPVRSTFGQHGAGRAG